MLGWGLLKLLFSDLNEEKGRLIKIALSFCYTVVAYRKTSLMAQTKWAFLALFPSEKSSDT